MFNYTGPTGSAKKKRETTEQSSPYVPIYFDQLNFTEEQKEVCNNDRQCMYDIAITGNQELALETREENVNLTTTVGILSKYSIK